MGNHVRPARALKRLPLAFVVSVQAQIGDDVGTERVMPGFSRLSGLARSPYPADLDALRRLAFSARLGVDARGSRWERGHQIRTRAPVKAGARAALMLFHSPGVLLLLEKFLRVRPHLLRVPRLQQASNVFPRPPKSLVPVQKDRVLLLRPPPFPSCLTLCLRGLQGGVSNVFPLLPFALRLFTVGLAGAKQAGSSQA